MLWQFVGCSAIDHHRTSRQTEPNEEEQQKHRTRPYRDEMQKISEDNIQAHSSIVQLPGSLRDITMMLVPSRARPPYLNHA